MSDTTAAAGQSARGGPPRPAYREHARSYGRRTGACQVFRQAVIEALPVSPGHVVLDVGCGTGLCAARCTTR